MPTPQPSIDSFISLYERVNVNPALSCEEIEQRLTERDHALTQQGLQENSAERIQVRLGKALLSNLELRATYDTYMLGERCTWGDINHLLLFHTLPPLPFGERPGPCDHVDSPAHTTEYPTPRTVHAAYAPPTAAAHNFSSPTPSFTPQTSAQVPVPFASVPLTTMQSGPKQYRRATALERLIAMVLDIAFAFIVMGIVGSIVESRFGTQWQFFAMSLVLAVYFPVTEYAFSASPAKRMLGMRVRDVETHRRPTVVQAAKRNWWRMVSIASAPGIIVSILCGAYYATTITKKRTYVGGHDAFASLEVVREDRNLSE